MDKKTHIQAWFSHNAAQFNDKIAIRYESRHFTYDQIEQQSNQLANFLIDQGASKGTLIGICSQDSAEIIIAIIAILKAGCVFVPLDPNLPDFRLKTIISDINLQWLIIDAMGFEKINNLTEIESFQLRLISREKQMFETQKSNLSYLGNYLAYSVSDLPTIDSQPDDICYLYFTSGSTGKPKGIAGRLKAIAHFINWEIETLKIQKSTRVSQLTSPSFDAFLRDMFLPLCSGGVVCVPDSVDTILDGRKLVRWIDAQNINLIHCVPSLFRTLLNEDLTPQLFSDLQYILLSGETIYSGDIARWCDIYGDRIQLVNLYGASETTMTKFFYFIQSSDQQRRTIPIGKPMTGATALIVDESGQASPIGMVGEIYIRTPYRTLGYYQQPELTNQVFIPNPFSNNPTDIVYKTGDLGRILPDGNFEYLGRKDKQVKIRGVRIELGEIEDYLRLHQAVKDAVVIDINDTNGNKYLCAYVVLNQELEFARLKDFLSQFLPTIMIPSSFVVMERLPRTISGKVDKKALPSPSQTVNRQFIAPRTPLEQELAQIWMKVLNIKQVGINDNFFALGGHSLLATQLVTRMGKAFQVEVPLRILFESPTLAAQAESIEALRWLTETSPRSLDGQTEEGIL
ncbi:MAG: non-ribosomal peptide synthetase [Crocosphaera sp.]|nr:non-ribosomal peptide synthetase [Crocosphaera sp.]